jgi:hypothetical protein
LSFLFPDYVPTPFFYVPTLSRHLFLFPDRPFSLPHHPNFLLQPRLQIESEFWLSLAETFDVNESKTIDFLELCTILKSVNTEVSKEDIWKLVEDAKLVKDEKLEIPYKELEELLTSSEENSAKYPMLSKFHF